MVDDLGPGTQGTLHHSDAMKLKWGEENFLGGGAR